MASTMTNLTRHELRTAGSDLAGSMLIDADGQGHLTVSSALGPAFSIDVSKLDALVALLAEAAAVRQAMQPLAGEVTAADVLGSSSAA